MSKFGLQIKGARERAMLSQSELADRAGISLSLLAQLEQGVKKNPTLTTMQALCKALGVSFESLSQSPAAKPRGRGRPSKAKTSKAPAKAKPKKRSR